MTRIWLLCLLWASASAYAATGEALAQVEQDDLAGAQGTLQDYLTENPQDNEARFLLARVLTWQGNQTLAQAEYQQLLQAEPNNADYLLGMGISLTRGGAPSEGLTYLTQARTEAPDYEAVAVAEQEARQLITAQAAPPPRQSRLAGVPVVNWTLAERPRRREIELSARYDWLTNNTLDGQNYRLDMVSTRAERNTYYGALTRQARFGEVDHGVELGVAYPLTAHWSAFTEAGFALAPAFLPNWYAEAGAERRFGRGFGLRAGYRRSFYSDSFVDRLALTGDRYWGAWRGAYTLNLVFLPDAELGIGHAATLTRFYAERSYWGLRAGLGREEKSEFRIDRALLPSVGLFGRHWFAPRWAVSWDVDAGRHDSQLYRYGARLGLRHAF